MPGTPKIIIVILLLMLPIFAVASDYYRCNETKQCGLQGDNTYRNIVLGPVVNVADAKQTAKIYQWARREGYWKELPDDVDTFIKKVQILSVKVPVGRKLEQISLLMGREDFDRSIIKPGDYIRYTPRDSSFFSEGYSSPEKDAYWKLYGCIAVLCSAEDTPCPLTYQSGIYRHADGLSLDFDNDGATEKKSGIDPQTYLPIKLPSSKKIIDLK
ncbi:MAG: hypothetical protein GQ546_01800 [Gammaproteobacteria bacterium]|nr:hypothetical protein [Gammaproteobacteria bacterium]